MRNRIFAGRGQMGYTGKRKEGSRGRKAAGALACLILGIFLLFAGPQVSAFASEGGSGGADAGDLTIEVVGEISIDDQIIIEDEKVPEAMFSEEPVETGPRHAVLMGCFLLGAIGYTVYFDRYDEKLFKLRLETARARKRAMEAEK